MIVSYLKLHSCVGLQDNDQRDIVGVVSQDFAIGNSTNDLKQTNGSSAYAPSAKFEKRQSNYDPITASQPS